MIYAILGLCGIVAQSYLLHLGAKIYRHRSTEDVDNLKTTRPIYYMY